MSTGERQWLAFFPGSVNATFLWLPHASIPPVSVSSSFGERVRSRRAKADMSQEDLAARVGISRVYLSQIERGVAPNVSPEVRRKLSDELGLTTEGAPSDTELGGLQRLIQEKGLTEADVGTLLRIEFRGRRPETYEEWSALYGVISGLLGERKPKE